MITSIKHFLIINLLIAMTIVSSLSIVGYYILESHDIQRNINNRLQQITYLVSEAFESETKNLTSSPITNELSKTKNSSPIESNRFLLQIWNQKNQLIAHSRNAPKTPLADKDNQFVSVVINNESWRAYSVYNEHLQLRIIAAEPISFQKNLGIRIIWDNLFILLCIYPILGFLIWFVVNQGFKPLQVLSKYLSGRETTDFSHLPLEKMSTELQPLIIELNKLFDRLKDAFEKNKNFASDAAHELRTPLAALKTQAQVSLLATSTEEMKKASQKLIHGVNRCTHIIQQLLTLSRIGQSEQLNDMRTVNLSSVASEIIAQLAPNAIQKNIEIELDSPSEKLFILANEISLGILIQNLIDNAIRYTPQNGSVIAKIIRDAMNKKIIFRVTDTGPGIPEELHDRVFERFYRVLGTKTSGSGLGLSIVKQIADLHHAKIKLSAPEKHPGLQIDVIFPSLKN